MFRSIPTATTWEHATRIAVDSPPQEQYHMVQPYPAVPLATRAPRKQQEECDNIHDRTPHRKSTTEPYHKVQPYPVVPLQKSPKEAAEDAQYDKKSRRRKSTSGAGALQDPITPRRSASSKNLKKQQEECANIDDKTSRRGSTTGAKPQDTTLPRRF
ncbi:hypothetical protein SEMRO_876_G214530.1 [Seminavis robusta]|uniref:Uncharacterized protein n=1 Tax=Seminavis robusta TaxID=568900 RepID=A0A9N8EFQ1_9STRA|nr:hypothetical protein SEMRO_876_G214530.1 [Seminavis robusta]|eukprot:Sro876_g214530.1 n/a (157) ;mRNA; f:29422-29892